MTRTCPYLTGNYILSCKADLQVYIPSVYELEEYCKSVRHTLCPSYCLIDEKKESEETHPEIGTR